MLPPILYIEETKRRYQENTPSRQTNNDKLKTQTILNVDSPDRVNLRLERLSRNPVALSTLSEMGVARATLSTTEFNQIVQERVLGQKDLMSISYLEYGLQVSQSVCRIILRTQGHKVIGYGTGFLVSPRLLMTNHHVLSSLQTAQNALVEFNYQSDLEGKLLAPISYELDPLTFFLTHEDLDYTLVAVQDQPDTFPLSHFGWNALIEEQGKLIIGEYVNIIQHPGGEPKQLALRENRVIARLDDFLHYQTDTAPGSSGSPVFNDQWELVALHHSGVPKTDEKGRFLTTEGGLWTQDMGEERIDWLANEGVRISRIIQNIKSQRFLTPIQRQLQTQLFDSLSPFPLTEPKSMNNNNIPVNSPNAVTWTIPLQISVSLGQVNVATPSQPVTPPPAAIPPTPEPTPDPEQQEELRILERARRGEIPYYDAQEDRENRERYYNRIIDDLNSLSSAQLYDDLHQLLERTHTKQLRYKPSTHVYPWVDLQPDLKLRSIYSKQEFTPEQIIQEDFVVEQARLSQMKEIVLQESMNMVQMQERISFLEAALPFNCEHVVPQSWFDKQEPMRGDLHHLFACESRCNSFRSNSPYIDFPDFEPDFKEAVRDQCGKSEERRFEPNFGQGEVARATLYFLLRYPGKINNSSQEYTRDGIKVLLKWHKDNPITEHERHRNMVIFRKQGNRNPLIDFPEWADRLDFTKGLG